MLTIPREGSSDVYLSVWPERPGSASAQLAACREELARALARAGAGSAQLVWETLFVAPAAMEGFLAPDEPSAGRPARWIIGAPPCAPGRLCELQAYAVAGGKSPPRLRPGPGSMTLERAAGKDVYLAGVIGSDSGSDSDSDSGRGRTAYEEALSMLEEADARLRGMAAGFEDVARTWIHLADIAADYDDFNRARRDFLTRKGIKSAPASTGVGGLPVPASPGRPPRMSLALHAVQPGKPGAPAVLRSPTLNEAPEYGSDFSRGMAVAYPDGDLVLVSGTSAVDEEGRSVAVGDFDRQLDRTLLNIEGVLRDAGADLSHVSLVRGYLKDRRYLDRYLEKIGSAGLLEAPHTVVEAEICRRELLCEIEVLAFRRRDVGAGGAGAGGAGAQSRG